MINTSKLTACLRGIGLDDWPSAVNPLIADRLSTAGHGDYDSWRQVVQSLQENASTAKEVRDLLNISPGTLKNLRINGALPYTRIGATIFYAREKVEQVLEQNQVDHRHLY